MKKQMDNVRGRLGDLAGLAGKTEAAERAILASAEKRLATVHAELQRTAVGVEAAPEKEQTRYLELTRERGQLQLVIGKARQVLGL